MSYANTLILRALFWTPLTLALVLLVGFGCLDNYVVLDWRDPLLAPGLAGCSLLLSFIGCLSLDGLAWLCVRKSRPE